MVVSLSRMLSTSPNAPAAGPDPALRALLGEARPETARDLLGHLLERRARPLVRDIVGGQLRRSGWSEADREDVEAGALLRLTEQLWAQREPGAEPIADLDAYVAVTAFNACHGFLRRRFPEMARLRSRLRYLLTHHPRLACWGGAGRALVCGLAAWRERPPVTREAVAGLRGRQARRGASELVELVPDLLQSLGGPCRFEDLAELVADALGLVEERPAPPVAEGRPDPVENLADDRAGPERALLAREALARSWRELRELPPRQRVALLLSLRDGGGQAMAPFLPLTGVATLQELAEALSMGTEALGHLLPGLPKDDYWIAEHLGLTRRQVINLRKCARERLARRLGVVR